MVVEAGQYDRGPFETAVVTIGLYRKHLIHILTIIKSIYTTSQKEITIHSNEVILKSRLWRNGSGRWIMDSATRVQILNKAVCLGNVWIQLFSFSLGLKW